MGLKKIKKEDHAPVNSMKGLFIIVKGQYSKTAPAITFEDGETRCIGGYNPANEDTSEWYQLMDKVTYETISCGSSLEKITNRLTKTIVQCGNDRDKYLSRFSNSTYEDDTGRLSRRVTTSPITKMMMKKVVEFYGDYFDDIIEEAEEKAFRELASKPKKTLKKAPVVKATPAPQKTSRKTEESPKKTIVKKKSSPEPKTKPQKEVKLRDFATI